MPVPSDPSPLHWHALIPSFPPVCPLSISLTPSPLAVLFPTITDVAPLVAILHFLLLFYGVLKSVFYVPMRVHPWIA